MYIAPVGLLMVGSAGDFAAASADLASTPIGNITRSAILA